MREKIAEMYCWDAFGVKIDIASPFAIKESFAFADKILALFPSLDGIVVEEKCGFCENGMMDSGGFDTQGKPIDITCIHCHGTGTITRQAEWGDIPIYVIEDAIKFYVEGLRGELTTKSGGRLRVKK